MSLRPLIFLALVCVPAILQAAEPPSMDLCKQRLLDNAPSAARLYKEARSRERAFSLTFKAAADMKKLIRMESPDGRAFYGHVNVKRIDPAQDAVEAHMAGILFLAHGTLHGTKISPSACLAFENQVRKELKAARPDRYGHLKPVNPRQGEAQM